MRSGSRLVALALALLVAYLAVPFFLRGFRFPVGADAGVYLWWTSLVKNDGLSAVGARAGIPAVVLVLSGALGIAQVTTVAGFQCALGAIVGVTASALVMPLDGSVGRRVLLVGATAGVFAASVAAGYLSTLGFVISFLGAATCLRLGTRRGAVIAAALLGAAGLTHPAFLALGVVVLACAAVLAVRAGAPDEATRIGGAIAGGLGFTAIGGLALLAGPTPLLVDTSRDGFLRRVGMDGLLHRLFVHRIFLHFWDYALFASVPLAVFGAREPEGTLRRLLWSWAAVTGVALLVGTATGWYPPERVISVAFVLPILAAFGIERLLVRRTVTAALVASLGAISMVGAAGWTWWHTVPPVTAEEAAAATTAARFAAAAPSGTPLVFEVGLQQPILTFYATRTANAIRAAMPPDRVRDVYVVVPPPGEEADAERRALATRYERDVALAVASTGRTAATFETNEFTHGWSGPAPGAASVAPGLRIADGPTAPAPNVPSPLLPTAPWKIAVTGVAALLTLGIVGSGWSRTVGRSTAATVALAPSCGLGVLVLGSILLERLGIPLARGSSGAVALVLTTATGWAAERVASRRRHTCR